MTGDPAPRPALRGIRSAPDGLARLGWPRFLLTALGLWLAPAALGLLMLLLVTPLGAVSSDAALYGAGIGYALLFSPMFSWIGWLIALPAAALALRLGWFGWLSAAAIGATAGGIAGEIVQTEIAAPFGLAALLLLRAVTNPDRT